jgi:general secretion pathway protein D
VLPRQAIIDARIFEVDLTDSFQFGISANLQAPATGQQLTTAGFTNGGALSASTFAFIGNSREILLALNALRSKTKVRILEAPSVLALDGTTAHIVVGSEYPYPGASYISGVGGTSSSVQYRDTGISLIVMPRISASGHVTLDVAQEVSSPGAAVTVGNGSTAQAFNQTRVQTTLSVRDGETVAIAGLIRNNTSVGRSGVPLLSDIPLLGSLFGSVNRSANRTELLILITPHVIRTAERFQEMTQELQDSLRNVRKLADREDAKHKDDMEDAREDRSRKEAKRIKKDEPDQLPKTPPPPRQ